MHNWLVRRIEQMTSEQTSSLKCMFLRPSCSVAFVVTAVQTEAGCDSSVGDQLKSISHSWLTNKQSLQARYERTHSREEGKKGQGSALPAAQKSHWLGLVFMLAGIWASVIYNGANMGWGGGHSSQHNVSWGNRGYQYRVCVCGGWLRTLQQWATFL